MVVVWAWSYCRKALPIDIHIGDITESIASNILSNNEGWQELYFEYVIALFLDIDNDVKRYEKMLILCAILLMEMYSGVELPMVSGEY